MARSSRLSVHLDDGARSRYREHGVARSIRSVSVCWLARGQGPWPNCRAGTVTFLLTDVEGSTALWQADSETMRVSLARHDALFKSTVSGHGGIHIRPRGEGDSRFAVFSSAPSAVAAALAIQRSFIAEAWPTAHSIKVRIGVHT